MISKKTKSEEGKGAKKAAKKASSMRAKAAGAGPANKSDKARAKATKRAPNSGVSAKEPRKARGKANAEASVKAAGAEGVAIAAKVVSELTIPSNVEHAELQVAGGAVNLTNLQKLFWPELGLTKRDLLQYYLDVSPWLLPHLKNRAMVMKRYPNGINGEFFFMKRAPSPRPPSIEICDIEHHSGNVIGFPVIQHVASLLWLVNLGCIDLNPWYARCDDVDRPDYLHFDLDPVEGTPFEKVLETSLLVREALQAIKIQSYAKTTGSRGIHVYVGIARGPRQKQVWAFAKAFAKELESKHPNVVTAEYRVAKRPAGRVLVDYNQNAWNRTLASVYSVRPKPAATVSTPVTWEEIEKGIRMEDFTMQTVPARLQRVGDLWKPLLERSNRVDLEKLL